MALSNYTDLQASVAGWLHRTDLTTQIVDFITLAEERFNRELRLRRMVTNAALTTTAGVNTVALPADWLETENVTLSSTSPPGAMEVITPEQMDREYPLNYVTGQPGVYTLVGSNLILGPTPDAVYTVSLDYYQKIPALATNSTNWLMTNYPSMYLSAVMVEAGVYTFDSDMVQLWDAKYQAARDALIDQDDRALRSGSQLRVRAL
jgi:hypothetical protein